MIAIEANEIGVSGIDYELHMLHALSLAQRVLTATPNPRVGCVIVNADNEVVGEGWHHAPGEAHAEINALNQAAGKTADAVAFVTLEPCAHYGKTPPCADALIAAGIGKTVIASLDPNPAAAGKGAEKLEQAGIEVVHMKYLEHRSRAINPGYMKRMITGLPYVRCKLAMSLDGRTAAANRESKWITGPQARSEVQQLRAESGAIITGINTVLQDDPSMTVRLDELNLSETQASHNRFAMSRQPMRVIMDSSMATPVNAKILQAPGEIKIFALDSVDVDVADYPATTEVITVSGDKHDGTPKNRVDPATVLELLASRFEVNEVLLEAGPVLSGALSRPLWWMS